MKAFLLTFLGVIGVALGGMALNAQVNGDDNTEENPSFEHCHELDEEEFERRFEDFNHHDDEDFKHHHDDEDFEHHHDDEDFEHHHDNDGFGHHGRRR